jgi:hypothetical protein
MRQEDKRFKLQDIYLNGHFTKFRKHFNLTKIQHDIFAEAYVTFFSIVSLFLFSFGGSR